MPYSELPVEDAIILAAEFVGRGSKLPDTLAAALPSNVLADILTPRGKHEHTRDRPTDI